MTATAARLGSAPIRLDWTHVLQTLHTPLRSPSLPDLKETWENLKTRFHSSDVGFYDCPIQDELSQAKETMELAQLILKKSVFKDCLMLGIGGSSLGPKSLLSSLKQKCSSELRFHFVENIDPLEWTTTLAALSPESTLVCSITKSGTTFETLAQTILALDWLGSERWKTHVVIITDPKSGDLRKFAQDEQIPSLSIAPSIGGRFSIFSPVGLFPAALAGLSVENFLLGARQVRDYLEKTDPEKNPIFIFGSELLKHLPKRGIHVCMPYSTRLRMVSDWFVQLWGESLGKEGKGFTPIAALGSTDQHSILQLLRDGPDDKITFFMTVDKVENESPLPLLRNLRAYPAFKILEGHSLHELLEIEYQATSKVLSRQQRPHASISLDFLDERSMGSLFFMLSVCAGFVGALWSINPFDQPGVEEGKVYIREMLGQGNAEISNAES